MPSKQFPHGPAYGALQVPASKDRRVGRVERAAGNEGERQALAKMPRCKVSKRVHVHEKLLSLYIKVSPPIDGIISISNISVIFA